MKYANIGGQAVMEGVMMKHGDDYAVAVRKPDHEIEVKTDTYAGLVARLHLKHVPILRGVAAFIDSLYLGMSTLTWSAGFYEDEEETQKTSEKEGESLGDKLLMGGTVLLSVVLAVGIFIALPFLAANLLSKVTDSNFVISLVEGVIRVVLFLVYIILISRMKDIQRVYMYHGAEHKTISCIEHGDELNVTNAAKYSRLHKRCGTSFLLIIVILCVIVHMLFFTFVPVEGTMLKLAIRLLMIPVIAGLAYEFLQWTGRHDSCVVDVLSKPGLMLQKLTTREPDDEMLEVAIASIEAIYDWRAFQEELKQNRGGEPT